MTLINRKIILMTIKIAAFVMLTFCLVVNLNAYFVEYAGTPYIATQRDCTPVYTYCGQGANSAARTFPFSTNNADMGQQLGWADYGGIWTIVYTLTVTAPPLNFSPHNGTGNGNYKGAANIAIMATPHYSQEYVINPLTETPEKAGVPQLISTTYAPHTERHPPQLTNCGRHNSE